MCGHVHAIMLGVSGHVNALKCVKMQLHWTGDEKEELSPFKCQHLIKCNDRVGKDNLNLFLERLPIGCALSIELYSSI